MRHTRKGLVVAALGAAIVLAACSTDGSVDPSASPDTGSEQPAETQASGEWFDQATPRRRGCSTSTAR